jgi:3,4-dihydroxy-2-butanone 4-phosphate synthase
MSKDQITSIPIEEAIEDSSGKVIIVVDDEDRER